LKIRKIFNPKTAVHVSKSINFVATDQVKEYGQEMPESAFAGGRGRGER